MTAEPGAVSPKPMVVRFDADSFRVDLADGRTLGIPFGWFPRLMHGTPELRANVSLSRVGLHWDGLDEEISVAGLLARRSNQTRARKAGA